MYQDLFGSSSNCYHKFLKILDIKNAVLYMQFPFAGNCTAYNFPSLGLKEVSFSPDLNPTEHLK